MKKKATEIGGVILKLTTGDSQVQEAALRRNFVSDAEFAHPYCWVPRFARGRIPFAPNTDSLWMIVCIYRWYRTLCPIVNIYIDSVAFDERNGVVYASIRQVFRLWFIPFYSAPVKLVAVLKVEKRASPSDANVTINSTDESYYKYYITRQEDLYQVNDCIQFAAPQIGYALWSVWQLVSTLLCVILSVIFLPLYYLLNKPSPRKE